MSEQELKLHVPAAARRALEREIKQPDAQRIRLHAIYFDTPRRELADARVTLRLRQEGRAWVQTVKTPGANAISRMELNHPRPGPALDLSVYAGTDLEPVLAGLKGELAPRYETDVTRLVRKVRRREGTVELDYDIGVLRAGGLELPISELEFELLSGRPAAIFAVARDWQRRYGLLLDPRSKAERGDRLAQLAVTLNEASDDDARARAIAGFWGPRGARAVKLKPDMTAAQAMAACAAECLDQIARNASVLAEADTEGCYAAGQPEHVHQLRVGIRRLRSAFRLFEGSVVLPPEALQTQIRTFFAAFGSNRDQDVLHESIIPALVAAGMPTFEMPAEAPAATSAEVAASVAFQAWLVDMLEWSLDVTLAQGAGEAADADGGGAAGKRGGEAAGAEARERGDAGPRGAGGIAGEAGRGLGDADEGARGGAGVEAVGDAGGRANAGAGAGAGAAGGAAAGAGPAAVDDPGHRASAGAGAGAGASVSANANANANANAVGDAGGRGSTGADAATTGVTDAHADAAGVVPSSSIGNRADAAQAHGSMGADTARSAIDSAGNDAAGGSHGSTDNQSASLAATHEGNDGALPAGHSSHDAGKPPKASRSHHAALHVRPPMVERSIPVPPPPGPDLRHFLARRLHKWHRKVLKDGAAFDSLDIPARHALRKRAKRLRYGLAFAESMLPEARMRKYRARLAAVQDVLGSMNDLSVAHDLYRQWSSRHPQAWFALGWISARQDELMVDARKAFKRLARARAFWKKGKDKS